MATKLNPKIEKLLFEKYVKLRDVYERRFKPKSVYIDNDSSRRIVYFNLSEPHGGWSSTHECLWQSSVGGNLGGLFNIYAADAAKGLLGLGRITKKEYEEFRAWIDETRERERRRTEITKLYETATDLGFKVAKKPKTRGSKTDKTREAEDSDE